MNRAAHLTGRIFLALIFIFAGAGKIANAAGTMGYMQAMGVPALLFWPTVVLELLGGIAIAIGFQTRLTAVLMAGFCVLSALIFHHNFSDQIQMIMFLKNMAIASGFLLLASSGATALSMDKAQKI